MDAHVGDHIVLESNKVGGTRRSGEVLEVIEGSGGQHYRVGWQDGHESIVYPSSDASVVATKQPPRRRR